MNWFKSKPTEEEKARFSMLDEKYRVKREPHQTVEGNRGNARLVNKSDYNEYLVLKKKFSGGKTRKRKMKRRRTLSTR